MSYLPRGRGEIEGEGEKERERGKGGEEGGGRRWAWQRRSGRTGGRVYCSEMAMIRLRFKDIP